MQFQKLTPAARDEILPFFTGLFSRTCDLTPGTLLMWRGVNSTEYALSDGSLFLRMTSSSGAQYYYLPLGGDLSAALSRVIAYAKGQGVPFRFVAVPREYLFLFEEGGIEYESVQDRDYFDYLYDAEALRSLAGKKYAKKRNLISQFDREYPVHRFADLTQENREAVLSFFHELMANIGESASHVEQLEREGCERVLSDPTLCGMQGAVLYVEEKIVGFSLGEVLGDTLFTHIEKADRAYKGVYQKLTNLFLFRFVREGVVFVNREDDAGDLGLRRAKMDYHPAALLEKYNITVK